MAGTDRRPYLLRVFRGVTHPTSEENTMERRPNHENASDADVLREIGMEEEADTLEDMGGNF